MNPDATSHESSKLHLTEDSVTQADAHSLLLGVVLEGGLAELTSNSALFITAEKESVRCTGAENKHRKITNPKGNWSEEQTLAGWSPTVKWVE